MGQGGCCEEELGAGSCDIDDYDDHDDNDNDEDGGDGKSEGRCRAEDDGDYIHIPS